MVIIVWFPPTFLFLHFWDIACFHGNGLKSTLPHFVFFHFPKIESLGFIVKVCKCVTEVCVFLNMMVKKMPKTVFSNTLLPHPHLKYKGEIKDIPKNVVFVSC